jgi:DNA-binding winged helix-turn-helix (wHTH) protein
VIYRFGIFDFEVESGQLRKNARPLSLERQPARVLAVLLARAGELVSREELRESVWGRETHVDFDRGLAYCLSQFGAPSVTVATTRDSFRRFPSAVINSLLQ